LSLEADLASRLETYRRQVVQTFDERVVDLLADTEFPGDADISDPLRRAHAAIGRANNYRRCGRYWFGIRCVPCKAKGRETFGYRHPVKCHLRGCSRCGPSVRLNLVNRYLFRLLRFRRRLLRHVILPFTWVGVSSVNLYDFLLSCVSKLWRRLGWLGCVSTVELKEEHNGQYYMHVHAIAVSHDFDYAKSRKVWRELTDCQGNLGGSNFVRFKEVYSQGGLLWYLLGYTLKDWLRSFEKAGDYVSVMRSLHRKRLLRAFGCLYGSRKRVSEKPSRGQGSLVVGEGSEATRTSIITKDSNKSRDLMCPVCGGSEWEWVDGPIVNGQLIVERSGDG
jgi:hypothetical protein